ncbi:MAG: hypothetical protein EBQ89_04290 [Alphaproteobacteria bacterium]|jgi:hypothetical protein|nr:hypothetical protein [Alphaproteobacteria bacterium]
MKSNVNSFIGDELANKVKVLSSALSQAQNMVMVLEKENQNLKDVLNNLTSINKEDCDYEYEVVSVK